MEVSVLDPAKFFEAAREYDRSADNMESTGYNRCATVDPDYTGFGPARVMFDGEEVVSDKAYQFIGSAPRANTRVVMLPIGSTYAIVGMVNGGA
jgi:hypothetical protein